MIPITVAVPQAQAAPGPLEVALRRLDMATLRIGLVAVAIGRDPRYTVQLADLHDVIGDHTAIQAAIQGLRGVKAEGVR